MLWIYCLQSLGAYLISRRHTRKAVVYSFLFHETSTETAAYIYICTFSGAAGSKKIVRRRRVCLSTFLIYILCRRVCGGSTEAVKSASGWKHIKASGIEGPVGPRLQMKWNRRQAGVFLGRMRERRELFLLSIYDSIFSEKHNMLLSLSIIQRNQISAYFLRKSLHSAKLPKLNFVLS